MKYLDEYRDGRAAARYARLLARLVTRPWTLMEVCGGQTHAIVRFGIDRLLPPGVELLHGPGCPVCVTPVEIVDEALRIAARPEVILCSFGDMLRVPGSARALRDVRAAGGDVRAVVSPLDALRLARQNPRREVVFFAVGFETTAPATALAVAVAHRDRIPNFSLLVAHVLVAPAMEAILSGPECRVQAFLAAGHVGAVMGSTMLEPLARRQRVPIVMTGFEPLDILQGVCMAVRQLEAGRAVVENPYRRVVRPEGNSAARALIAEVFTVVPRRWRGIGELPASGLALRPELASFDAATRFGPAAPAAVAATECQSGLVLRGRIKPPACPAFGTRCTPEHPLGATMVSSEGACAAYHRYRHLEPAGVGHDA